MYYWATIIMTKPQNAKPVSNRPASFAFLSAGYSTKTTLMDCLEFTVASKLKLKIKILNLK